MNKDKKAITSRLLRALADAVDALDEQEFQEVLASGGLKFIGRAAPQNRRKSPSSGTNLVSRSEQLMDILKSASSRGHALMSIDSLRPTRAVLEAAAKIREIHVTKQDTVAVLKHKLIENVVGSRLDSDAIQNG